MWAYNHAVGQKLIKWEIEQIIKKNFQRITQDGLLFYLLAFNNYFSSCERILCPFYQLEITLTYVAPVSLCSGSSRVL